MALGLAAVVAALGVLLALQYRWLADLERASTIARRASLEKYLDVAGKEVALHYQGLAERVLNVPSSAFTPEYFGKAAWRMASKLEHEEGISRLYLVSYHPETAGLYYLYPEGPGSKGAGGPALAEPPFGPEVLAVWAANAPWSVMAKKGGPIEARGLAVDERDPRYRILLNPVTDEKSRLVGLAGMVLDAGWFEREVLPAAMAEALALAPDRDALAVAVWDGRGRLLRDDGGLAAADRENGGKGVERAVRRLPFVFTDWKLGLADRHSSPEQWARANFLVNLGLSAALGLVLLGGVALAARAAAREMKLSEMKNDFVSNVSHELRTPLSSIRVFGEFLRLGRVDDPGKVREYGEYIETESRRLTRLIDNILDFSRIESGRKVYQMEEADVAEVVAEALATFEVRLRHQGFRIYLDGPEAPLPRLAVDAGAIGQAVANLVDNAVKYSGGEEGSREIRSREITVRLGRTRRSVTIAVQDHGIGISRDEQRRIFERFHRVSTGAVHDVRGSGLGLSIVRHVVHAHGGRVTVESEPGRGSTFTIHLPIEQTADRAAAGAFEAGEPTPAGAAAPSSPAPEAP